MLKKIIALLLCSQLFVSMVSVYAEDVVEQSEEAVTQVDMEIPLIGKEADTLTALGIFNENDVKSAYSRVTRIDFARMIYKFSAFGVSDAELRFTDIDEKDSQYVNYVIEQKYIENTSDDVFRPNDEVTAFQFIKGVVTEMGYEPLARMKNGYINAAKEIDIVEGALAYDGGITYKEVAELMYKGLLTGMGRMALTSGSQMFEVADKTYIEDRFDAEIFRGTVQGTDRTKLYETDGSSHSTVIIDLVEYETAIDMYNYLGYRGNYILQNIDGYDTVIAFYDEEKRTDTKEIADNQILSFSNNRYTYVEDDKKKTVDLELGYSLIYNGKYVGSYLPQDMLPQNGNVKLIDADQNGRFETVIIYDYQTKVVVRYNENEGVIYDKNGAASVNVSDIETVDIMQSGKHVDPSSIRENSILSVAVSKDGAYAAIEVSAAIKTGSIGTVSKDNIEYTIVFDGSLYEINEVYFDTYVDQAILANGASVKAYFDHFGRVVYMEATTSDLLLGFLMKARYDEEQERMIFRIYKQDNELDKNRFGAEKIKMDGRVCKKYNDILDVLKKGEADVAPQIIRYRLNAEGEICEIDTPYNDASMSVDPTPYLERLPGSKESKESFRIIYGGASFEANPENFWYKPASATFGRRVRYAAKSENVPVLIRPTNSANISVDTILFSTVKDTFLMDQSYKTFDMYSYGPSTRIGDLFVYYNDAGFSADETVKGTTVAMVAEIQEVYDEELEEPVAKMTLAGAGSSVEAIARKDTYWKEVLSYNEDGRYRLDVGDVVWYDRDQNTTEITAIRLLWDASDPNPRASFKGNADRAYGDILQNPGIRYVDVYDIEEEFAITTTKDLSTFTGTEAQLDLTMERIGHFPNNCVHIFDSEEKTVSVSGMSGATNSWKDVKDYKRYGKDRSRIICVTKWGYALCMFIIK